MTKVSVAIWLYISRCDFIDIFCFMWHYLSIVSPSAAILFFPRKTYLKASTITKSLISLSPSYAYATIRCWRHCLFGIFSLLSMRPRVRPYIPKVSGRNILWTTCGNFTKFTIFVHLGQVRNGRILRSQGQRTKINFIIKINKTKYVLKGGTEEVIKSLLPLYDTQWPFFLLMCCCELTLTSSTFFCILVINVAYHIVWCTCYHS